MNTGGLVKYAGAIVALAILSACGGGSAVAPSTATLNATHVGRTLFVNGRPLTAARLSPLPTYATIVPDRHTKSKTFEYVFNDYGSYASIFDYPKSDQQIGADQWRRWPRVHQRPLRLWKEDFWNIGGVNQITEYRVPNKPIRTLSVPYTIPTSCAMDTSGDLAVGILVGTKRRRRDLQERERLGHRYTTPLAEEYFDGYDSQGISSPTALTAAMTSNSSSSRRAAASSNDHNEQLCAVPWLRAVGRHLPHRVRSGHE